MKQYERNLASHLAETTSKDAILGHLAFGIMSWLSKRAGVGFGIADWGDTPSCSSAAFLRVVNPREVRNRLARKGSKGLAEAIITGAIRGGTDSDADLLAESEVLVEWFTAQAKQMLKREAWLAALLPRSVNFQWKRSKLNDRRLARHNADEHYSLDELFFVRFLDRTMAYSAGEFEGAVCLEDAQVQKFESILDLADVRPGSRVLDVGSGWGGLAIYAAITRGAVVDAITVSQRQFDVASALVNHCGLSNLVTVKLKDYRDIKGVYDSIISVEMLEAVGARHLCEYFDALERVSHADTRWAFQAIFCPDIRLRRPVVGKSWMDEYIFPGGELVVWERLQRAVDSVSNRKLRLHKDLTSSYAATLRAWRANFCASLSDSKEGGEVGALTARAWALYFAYCEAGFRSNYIRCAQFSVG